MDHHPDSRECRFTSVGDDPVLDLAKAAVSVQR